MTTRFVSTCARALRAAAAAGPSSASAWAWAAPLRAAAPRRALSAASAGASASAPPAVMLPAAASADDLSEDAYDVPDSAPPPPRHLRPIDVASGLMSGVQDDKQQRELERRHTLAVLVDNESGVLAKISGLLSARGFNIDSLTVSPTNIQDLSRITVVLTDVPEGKATQAVKQLSDVVNVWAVVDYTGTNSLQRELVMVKVAYQPIMPTAAVAEAEAGAGTGAPQPVTSGRPGYRELLAAQGHKTAVRDLGQLFGAEVVDVGSRHIVFQLTAWSRRIDAFIRMLEPFGIIEVARSGVVAMLRSPVAGSPAERLRTPSASTTDASQLPPG